MKGDSSEVPENLNAIYNGARTYYEAPHAPPGSIAVLTEHLPGTSTGLTPTTDCCAQGGRCAVEASQWRGAPGTAGGTWEALNFSIETPHYYRYSYTVANNPNTTDGSNNFTATAIGDLDCDGITSTFTLSGSVDATKGDGVSGSGMIVAVRPTE